MSEKSKNKCGRLIPWFVLLYMVILAAERIQSLVRILAGHPGGWFASPFDGYVNCLAAASLCATAVLLAVKGGAFWKSLGSACEPDWNLMTLFCGVLLVSGMVHTEYTIPVIQFIAYGALIIAMIIRTACVSKAGKAFRYWYSLIYLTAFSMAIPVVYRSFLEWATVFHIVEAVVSLALVVLFSLPLAALFRGEGENLLWKIPALVAAAGDAAVLALRWREEINMFVLIFISLTVVLFCAGLILFRRTGKQS